MNQALRKPWAFQRLAAQTWPWVAALYGIPIFLTVLGGVTTDARGLKYVLTIFVSAGGSLILTWLFLALVQRLLTWLNGGPFREGDRVQILRGQHEGKIASVYEIWERRGQVRLDLGGEAKKTVTDVFSHIQVLRAKKLDSAD